MTFKVPIRFMCSGYAYVEAENIDEAIQKTEREEVEINYMDTEFVPYSIQIVNEEPIKVV